MAYNLQSFMQRIAAVAVRLATPRKIADVDFDGSKDIGIPLENLSNVNIVSPVDGQALVTDGTGFKNAAVAAGGSPGGSNTQIQYNNDGAFAGDSGLVYDKTNKRLGVGTAPSAPIEISTPGINSYLPVAHFFAPKNTGNRVTQLRFGNNPVSCAEWRYIPNSGGISGLGFSGVENAAITYLINGNVGINNDAPSEKLDVIGNIKVSGTIQGSFKSSDGSSGASGTFTSADSKTVTVKNGIITNIA